MMRAASVNADGRGMLRRVVVRLDHDMSTFTIYDSVSEALKQTNTGSASFYNNLNKTWFHLEECLSHLCKTTSAHKHEIANQIVKQSIKQFKIHWHKHSHAQDTWEPLDNVHLKTIISFFRDRPCMQTIIDHKPKLESWVHAVQAQYKLQYKVVDHENHVCKAAAKSKTRWVNFAQLSADCRQYLDEYWLTMQQ